MFLTINTINTMTKETITISPIYYIISGLLVSTYIVNAIGATFYGSKCISIMSYNSPICATTLLTLTSAATLNYWIYYACLTSIGIWGFKKIKSLIK